jgi:hypothetical protein
MPSTLLSVLFALAVFLAAPWASAQGGEGHCLTEPMTLGASSIASQPLPAVKTPAKDLSWAVSRHALGGARVASPRPVRPLEMCVDPHQPGCQIDRPDVPERHGAWHLDWESAWLTLPFEDFPSAPEGGLLEGLPCLGGPREGFARPCFRPPVR